MSRNQLRGTRYKRMTFVNDVARMRQPSGQYRIFRRRYGRYYHSQEGNKMSCTDTQYDSLDWTEVAHYADELQTVVNKVMKSW